MTIITHENGIWTGVSEDNMITYRSIEHGPVIGGRRTWRKEYVDASGKASGEYVDGEVWARACIVMSDVDAAAYAANEAKRQSALDHLDAMAESIPDRMTDFFRKDSDL